eukprot:6446036-Pyramimonas_sp.AAC.1
MCINRLLSCGAFTTGTAGHLLIDCPSGGTHRLSERAVRNRRLFMRGFHPADEGMEGSRRFPAPRSLLASDPETHGVRLHGGPSSHQGCGA